MLVAIYLSVTPLIMTPSPKYLIGLGFLLAGIPIYYCCVYKRKHPVDTGIILLLQSYNRVCFKHKFSF